MPEDFLAKARQQAEKAEPSLRAAALLRIARAESAADVARSKRTLLEGLEVITSLPVFVQEFLFIEAREVAAAISPTLLAEIPISGRKRRLVNLVQIMLRHGHVDAAFHYLMDHDDESFPFRSAGGILHRIDVTRRLLILRRAVDVWQRGPFAHHDHERSHFVWLFGHFWKEFPGEEALSIARMIVAQAIAEPDTETSAGYMNQVRFTSCRQNTLSQMLHVLRRLDPALAQSLIDSHDQLAAGVRRYPNGLETMNEEATAEAERRKAEGAACGAGIGYGFAGDSMDFDRQRRLLDATRSGDFEPSIQDAVEKYREDMSLATRNYAPKEYWPSTGAFRTVGYEAGKQLGIQAAKLLERIPDHDIRLFATIEMAAALAGLPPSSISHIRQSRPPVSMGNRG